MLKHPIADFVYFFTLIWERHWDIISKKVTGDCRKMRNEQLHHFELHRELLRVRWDVASMGNKNAYRKTSYCRWCRQFPESVTAAAPFRFLALHSRICGWERVRLRHLHSINIPVLVFHSHTIAGTKSWQLTVSLISLTHSLSLSLHSEGKNFLDVLRVDGRIILKWFYRLG